jgi:hypothetical protein
MMEIKPFRGKHYDAECEKCETYYRGSYKQVSEVRETHNARLHPRRWRKLLRRLEILAELNGVMKDVFDHAETPGRDEWDHALPFWAPPLERARLKEEGLLPVAPEQYRREFDGTSAAKKPAPAPRKTKGGRKGKK